MKKNLLTALVVFIFTMAVILVINDVSSNEDQQVESQYYAVED